MTKSNWAEAEKNLKEIVRALATLGKELSALIAKANARAALAIKHKTYRQARALTK